MHQVQLRFPLVVPALLSLCLSGCGGCDSPDNGGDDLDPRLTDQVQVVAGRVLEAGTLSPIEGAVARLGELETETDARGRFAFRTWAAERQRAVRVSADGFASVERVLPPEGRALRDVGSIVLFAFEGRASIGPDGGTLDVPSIGVLVEVPKGAFKEQVELGVSRLPLGDNLTAPLFLPAPVPAPPGGHSAALFALIIDSAGVQPSKDIGVRVETVSLPRGTSVPVGRFDPLRGRWVDAGLASHDGAHLRFSIGHLSTYAGALPALPSDGTKAPSTASLERSISPFMPGDPRIDPRSGAMQVGFSLPSLTRRGEELDVSLFYDSRTVVPAVRVPVVATDAAQGERFNARVLGETHSSSLEVRVEDGAAPKAAPATVVEAPDLELPDRVSSPDDSELASLLERQPGTEVAQVEIAREGEGHLAECQSGSFTEPRPGPPLKAPDGELIPAPSPIEHRSSEQVAVAIDNRGRSRFGPGWHLSGLTRIVQPWCGVDLLTLVGELDWPAVTFGRIAEPVVRPLGEVFSKVDIDEDDLRYARVASSGSLIYVALPEREEVWTLNQDGSDPVRVAGGGFSLLRPGEGVGTELLLPGLIGVAAGPRGEGVLISTEYFVTHLKPDGTATRVVGTGEDCQAEGLEDEIKPGEPARSSRFCFGLSPTLAADPTSDRFLFGALGYGTFEVKDGVLEHLRAKEGAGPHWHNAAFDQHGRLFYGSDTGDCIYLHVDGLEDEELFPRCRDWDVELPEDGPANEAVARGARAITVDRNGNLWFIDNWWNTLRRYREGGELLTVSGRAEGSPMEWATVSGGLLGDSVLGYIESIAVPEAGRIFMGGSWPGDLVTTAPIPDGTLVSMGSGDGSILRRLDDGRFLRVLESGVLEYYDERGLLESRGKPGEPPLEYVYQGSWEKEPHQEICGLPDQPPRLARIRLSGEDLWRLDYDGSGRLNRITDAAGRAVSRRVVGERGDSYSLPGGREVAVSYNEAGMVTEKTSPGFGGAADRWRFEWEDRKLVSVTVPGGRKREVSAADDGVTVPQYSFDALRVARDVSAKIPVAEVPTGSGEKAKVVVGTSGVLVESPAGDQTELETDTFGRLLRVTLPDGSALRLTRDEIGRLMGLVNETTGESWRYTYRRVEEDETDDPNVQERLVERVDHRHRRTLYRYDGRGMLSARVDPGSGTTRMQNAQQGAARGLPEVVWDQENRVYEVSYDRHGNIVSMSVRDNEEPSIRLTTEIERDAAGRVTRITEPSGKTVRTEYDVWGEPTKVTVGDPGEGHVLVIERASSAAWRNSGSSMPRAPILSATDGEGRTWTNRFGPTWKLLESIEPARGRTFERYDAEGRVIDRQLADGSREEFEYDEAGRVEERRWLGPAAGSWASFVYEDNGRVAELLGAYVRESRELAPGFGWTKLDVVPTSLAGPEAQFSVTRRRWGDDEAQELGGSRYVIRRGFDDKVERVRLEAWPSSPVDALVIEYDRSRKIVGMVRGNGTRTTLVRDALGRAIRQEEVTPNGTTVLTWTWSADRPERSTIGSVHRGYQYDSFGRLLACSDTGESYTYDLADGRASDGPRSYLRDAEGRLMNDGVFTYEHDVLGRRTVRRMLDDPSDRTVYSYGPGGWLEAVSAGPEGSEVELASYAYDAAGRRVARTTAEGTWYYGYPPESERLIRVVEPDGIEWHLVHALPSAAFSVASASGGRKLYTHLDPFDRVIGVSNEAGELTLIEETCFGARLELVASGGPDVGFHGMPYDAETGLYYAGARYYDPSVGAFLSPDPLGLAAAPSLYDYAAGNPVMAQDPSGRLLFAAMGAALVGGLIFNEIRKVAQSSDVSRARRSYEAMTDAGESDTALATAEKAHQRLATASRRGGATAVESTVKAVQAVANPASNWKDVGEAARDLAESVMDSSDGGYYDDGDD